MHKDGAGAQGSKIRGWSKLQGSAGGQGDWERLEGNQALRACHCATLVRGLLNMSFQCFTSAGPLFHDR